MTRRSQRTSIPAFMGNECLNLKRYLLGSKIRSERAATLLFAITIPNKYHL